MEDNLIYQIIYVVLTFVSESFKVNICFFLKYGLCFFSPHTKLLV